MRGLIIMFSNAGLAFCYDKFKCQYSVVEECSGKDEIVTGDALSAWAYYIQRVDTIVRRRISAAEKKQSSVREFSEEDVKNAMGKTRSLNKKVREKLKVIKSLHGAKTALEMALRKANANKNIQLVNENAVIQLHRTEEKAFKPAVGDTEPNRFSLDRVIENLERKNNE